MKSAIYTQNLATGTVGVGGVIPLGSTVRRFGSNLMQNGNTVTASGTGYYNVEANVVFEGTATTVSTINILQDGVIVSSAGVTCTDGGTYTVPVSAVIRNKCCDSVSNISLSVSTTAIDLVEADLIVEKV